MVAGLEDLSSDGRIIFKQASTLLLYIDRVGPVFHRHDVYDASGIRNPERFGCRGFGIQPAIPDDSADN